jgi:hypothetical protein
MDNPNQIKIKTQFANAAYQDFKSKRFGLTPCCHFDFQTVTIKNDLCEWEKLSSKKLTPSTGLTIKIIDCATI